MTKMNWLKAHKYQIVAAVLALTLILILTAPEEPGISYTPSTETKARGSETPKQEPFQAITLSGSGSKLTDPFELKAGGYKVISHYVGESNFQVYVINSQGDEGPLLANEIGSTDVSDVFKANGGQYRFKVGADGPWTIKIEAL